MQNQSHQTTTVREYLSREGYPVTQPLAAFCDEIEKKIPANLRNHLLRRDGAARLIRELPQAISTTEIGKPNGEEVWHLCGLFYFNLGRFNEALAIFSAMYEHMLQAQLETGTRLHKGTPLVRISECHLQLQHPVVGKRYLMLTLCEDAIRDKGHIPADTTGLYFRMVWERGFSHQLLGLYAAKVWQILTENPEEGLFPEWIVQELDQDWITEFPSVQEAGLYFVSPRYIKWLHERLGLQHGKVLERLAHYLVSAMPGCRAQMRSKTFSTDYDVVCTPEGLGLDFRSELGRYFICECKDWNAKADFTTIAKFCRVLDAAKCSFGILFSKEGITGEKNTTDAAREQVKVFQQRGMVVVVVSAADIKAVEEGTNFITLLRRKYEQVRLDLKSVGTM
jgi:hypothetical protein